MSSDRTVDSSASEEEPQLGCYIGLRYPSEDVDVFDPVLTRAKGTSPFLALKEDKINSDDAVRKARRKLVQVWVALQEHYDLILAQYSDEALEKEPHYCRCEKAFYWDIDGEENGLYHVERCEKFVGFFVDASEECITLGIPDTWGLIAKTVTPPPSSRPKLDWELIRNRSPSPPRPNLQPTGPHGNERKVTPYRCSCGRSFFFDLHGWTHVHEHVEHCTHFLGYLMHPGGALMLLMDGRDFSSKLYAGIPPGRYVDRRYFNHFPSIENARVLRPGSGDILISPNEDHDGKHKVPSSKDRNSATSGRDWTASPWEAKYVRVQWRCKPEAKDGFEGYSEYRFQHDSRGRVKEDSQEQASTWNARIEARLQVLRTARADEANDDKLEDAVRDGELKVVGSSLSTPVDAKEAVEQIKVEGSSQDSQLHYSDDGANPVQDTPSQAPMDYAKAAKDYKLREIPQDMTLNNSVRSKEPQRLDSPDPIPKVAAKPADTDEQKVTPQNMALINHVHDEEQNLVRNTVGDGKKRVPGNVGLGAPPSTEIDKRAAEPFKLFSVEDRTLMSNRLKSKMGNKEEKPQGDA